VPRLNAQGRLGEARDVVELLVTGDEVRAAELASQFEGMNARRQLEARLVEDSATSLLEKDPSLFDYAAIVLAHPEWADSRERNSGIVGLVAGRLAERYQRPVVLLGEQDGLLAGAARATPGNDLLEVLRDCADLLVGYRGQAMAAGLSMRPELLFEFRRRFSGAVRRQTATRVGLIGQQGEPPLPEPIIQIDGVIDLTAITPDLVEDLRRLGPFGNGNPPLTLVVPDLRLVRQRRLGRRGDHLDLQVEDSTGRRQRVLWWRSGEESVLNGADVRFSLAAHLVVQRYRGKAEIVLEALDLLPEAAGLAGEVDSPPPRRQIEDYRDDPSPEATLATILARAPAAIVWAEGEGVVTGLRRDQLRPAEMLVVWTAPPGPVELAAALARVEPHRLVIFNRRPEELTVENFLPRLGGLIRYILRARRGETTLDELGGLLAQRGEAVRAGLRWFEASGQIALDIARNGEVKMKRFAGAGPVSRSRIEALLRSCLEETAAYRRAGPLFD
jgi:single-stranded-DNA-specific exonuclease